ncbi:MAG: acetate/propionate family kinase [Deltaproteobacteria bacterium]|nr:acetate/propionate family kinase [Deltaproteobacteria bacterium]
MDVFEILRSVEALKGFDDVALRRLVDKAWVEDYSAGQRILVLGQLVEAIGVVVSGQVEVAPLPGRGGDPVLVPDGQLFGEISLLTGEPAIADVIAASSSRVVHVPHSALTQEIGRTPIAARELAKLLTERLAKRGDDPDEQAAVDEARRTVVPAGGNGEREIVLVLNLGSSSIKYALIAGDERLARGVVDRVGQSGARLSHRGPGGKAVREIAGADHEAGLRAVFEALVDPDHGGLERLDEIDAVGHRAVHGSVRFSEATIVDDAVKDELRRASVLAPLHNPVNLLGIEVCEKLLPTGIPQVAVFDTAFHMTMPEHAFRYALPRDFADQRNLRRFGFHGTSHKYVSRTACAFLGKPPASLRMITCHLGGGASITAVDHGRSVDTSMGLTPLEGLVMGTRAGDVDPGLILHLLREGMAAEEIDELLNKRSGLLGLSGISGDMQELEQAADRGDTGALLAIQVFCYRVRKYIGAYTAVMGGLDALVFTGGIGEHAAGVRSRICQGLACFGIGLDQRRNREGAAPEIKAQVISTEDAAVTVLVVPTDEEGSIAGETLRAIQRSGAAEVLEARRDRPIRIGVSAHHVHLCQDHVEQLFGAGHQLTPRNELSQPGQFACEERVNLVGPKGRVDRVRILGPARPRTQVEISRTEEFKLGIDAPIRASGDVESTPGLTLVGSAGELELAEGVICALRHIHVSPENALSFGLRDRDVVRVEVEGERSLVFGDVLVRVHPSFTLEMHIDTDEANAAEIDTGMSCTIDSIQRRGA